MTHATTLTRPARRRWATRAVWLLVALVFWFILSPLGEAQAQRNSGRVKLEGIPGLATQSQPLYQESHALLIGASQYRNGWKPLPGVKKDMVAVKAALEKHGFTVQVVADPTRYQLDTALRNFVADYGQEEGNRLLVYFAGHGESLDAKTGSKLGYIVPVDAPLPQKDMAGFKRLAYSMDAIEVHARQIEARHALFVFDSCFSGTIFAKRANVPTCPTASPTKPAGRCASSSLPVMRAKPCPMRASFVSALCGR